MRSLTVVRVRAHLILARDLAERHHRNRMPHVATAGHTRRDPRGEAAVLPVRVVLLRLGDAVEQNVVVDVGHQHVAGVVIRPGSGLRAVNRGGEVGFGEGGLRHADNLRSRYDKFAKPHVHPLACPAPSSLV
jgi:hypothetical protein